MHKLQERLDALAKALGLQTPLLQRARRRYKANRKRAFQAHAQQVTAQKAADRLRSKGHEAKAKRKDAKAIRLGHVAFKNHSRAQFWLGRVKVMARRVHGIESGQEALKVEIGKWYASHGAIVRGDKAEGGTSAERKVALALSSVAACSTGKRANFYSQSGATDVKHPVSGESYGERSDCSSYATSLFFGAGDPDPNSGNYRGTMYTGTLPSRGRKVSESEMKRHKFGLVLYGTAPYHHVECWIGPGDRTAGHGSSPVDFGVVDLFGDSDFDCYVYD